jgi:outer membrane biosynthesis protein TonB
MRLFGLVKIEATVDAAGKVTAVRTLSGSRVLSPAAGDAVGKGKFVPGAGPSTVEVEINFNLGP